MASAHTISIVVLVAVVTLSACQGCGTDIAVAANDDEFGLAPSREQRNRWMPSPRLDGLLPVLMRPGGVTALTKEHGFQCVPRQEPDKCPDCYICVTAFPVKGLMLGFATKCTLNGTMHIRAEVGPKESVRSMTYWDPPPGPDHSRENR